MIHVCWGLVMFDPVDDTSLTMVLVCQTTFRTGDVSKRPTFTA